MCLLEAVNLSSTNRCPVTRVLPPSRPPQRHTTSQSPHLSQSSLTPQLSHQPTSRAPPLLVISQTPVLPSLAEQPVLKAAPIIPQSVVPLSAGVSAPNLSPSVMKLDLTGQKVGSDSAMIPQSSAPGKNTLLVEDMGRGKIVLPTLSFITASVSEGTTSAQETGGQPSFVLPDDLSVKSK